MGWSGPSFRCPPRLVGSIAASAATTTGVVIAVRLRGRPWAAVLADMIEGVVVANRLQPPHADRLRADLWELCGVEQVERPARDITAPIARVA